MEILVNLPDMTSTLDGGRLFEYEFDGVCKDELVISRHRRFKSSHKIDAPVSAEMKRKRVELILHPENIL